MYSSPTDSQARPAREQNLFIGFCKHLYCLRNGRLKYQSKPLDPRIQGKVLIRRFVLLDVDTGTVYGECHSQEDQIDLLGFLARAWSKKFMHPMRGIPEILNVPQIAHSTWQCRAALDVIAEMTQIEIGTLRGGVSAGVHAVRQFDEQVLSLFWRRDGGEWVPPKLTAAQACSGLLSASASSLESLAWEKRWQNVEEMPESILAKIDTCYLPPGAWRTHEPFNLVLTGPSVGSERG